MGSVDITNPVAVPQGSLVLVTGATGFLAAHIVLKFLQSGYKVRGSVRSREKAAFLSKGEFEQYSQDGSLELVDVPDMTVPGAYKEAVRGVAVVANVASDVSMSSDVDRVVDGTVSSLLELLRTAAAEPSVRRFVHCSSVAAICLQSARTDDCRTLTQDTWNEEAVHMAYNPEPADGAFLPLTIYAASKTKAEQAAFEFLREEKPGFVFNSVLPAVVFGRPFTDAHRHSSLLWAEGIYTGKVEQLPTDFKLGYISVQDVATLHVAAALDPEVENRRILGIAERFNCNTLLARARKVFPDHQFMDDFPGVEGQCGFKHDETENLALLKKWGGSGWVPLEDAYRESLALLVNQ